MHNMMLPCQRLSAVIMATITIVITIIIPGNQDVRASKVNGNYLN